MSNDIQHLFAKNVAWAKEITDKEPNFFTKLSAQQNPKYLWIGCSDSRVAANQIINLPPGEVFVHRNIANVVAHSDLNCLSVIQYAVEVLKVRHIIVCGHYGCGGVQAAIDDENHRLIDNWLLHVKHVLRINKDKLDKLSEVERFRRLCELNVMEQVTNVCNSTIVQNAWNEGAKLSVHGWIYGIDNGIIKDLHTTRDHCIN